MPIRETTENVSVSTDRRMISLSVIWAYKNNGDVDERAWEAARERVVISSGGAIGRKKLQTDSGKFNDLPQAVRRAINDVADHFENMNFSF